MNQSAFAVTRFENRNGLVSWRVDGRLHGVRIRKNVKTRDEAIAEKGTLELKAMQADTGMRYWPSDPHASLEEPGSRNRT